MRIPPVLWAVYVVVGLTLEFVAIASPDTGDTLTETTVRVAAGTLGTVLVLSFLGWALVHFARRLRWTR